MATWQHAGPRTAWPGRDGPSSHACLAHAPCPHAASRFSKSLETGIPKKYKKIQKKYKKIQKKYKKKYKKKHKKKQQTNKQSKPREEK
jgi:hypothetical protein